MQLTYLHPADQLLMIMQRIYDQGMTTTSGGNLSIKDDSGNIWITPGGIDKGTLTRQDIVCVKPNGDVEGIHKPSSEFPFHASVYRRRPDLKAVLHAHPTGLVAFSLVRKIPNLKMMTSTYQECRKAAIAAYAIPGSEQLGENIAKHFDNGYDIVFLENHGICIGAQSIFDAFCKFETIEYTANLEIAARSLGTIHSLPDNQLRDFQSISQASTEPFELMSHTPEELGVRRDMIPFIHRAYRQGFINSTTGSFSVRLSDGSFVITPSGKDRYFLDESDLVLCKDGKHEAGKHPSGAVSFHAAVYEKNSEIQSVILASPINIMAFAVTGTRFDARTIPESYLLLRESKMMEPEMIYANRIETAGLFTNSVPAIIFKNDSIAVTGSSILNAFDRLEVAEVTAHSIVSSRSLGEIVHIHDEDIDDIKTAFHLKD